MPSIGSIASMMRAAVFNAYGPPRQVLRIESIPVPTPTGSQILVEVRAASINALDWRCVAAEPWVVRAGAGMTGPRFRTPGSDFAGVVTAVGPACTNFKVGDDVFGSISIDDGLGTFAEYVTVNESSAAKKPAGLSFEDAAALPVAGLTALQALRDVAEMQPGARVLVTGASGGVGSMAVMVAKALGAGEVTAECGTANVEMVRKIGADKVIDYTKADYTASGERYDVIIDAAATKSVVANKNALATEGGRYVFLGTTHFGFIPQLLALAWHSTKTHKLATMVALSNTKDLETLAAMAVEGKVRPAIAETISLDNVVDGIERVRGGHPGGKIVVVPKL